MSWFLMQSVERTHLHAWIEPMRNASVEGPPLLGRPTDSLLAFNASVCELHFDLDAWTERGRTVMRVVESDPDWLMRVVDEAAREVRRLRLLVESLADSDYFRAAPGDLADSVAAFFGSLKRCHLAGLPIVILETRHELWTDHARGLIRRALDRAGLPEEDLPSTFSLLSTPDRPSSRVRERLARGRLLERLNCDRGFMKLLTSGGEVSPAKVSRDHPSAYAEVLRHARQFGWISYVYQGPGWGPGHFLRELATMAESGDDPRETRAGLRRLKERRNSLEASLRLTPEERRAVVLTRQLMYVKDARKEATYFAFAKSEGFWRAVSERIRRSLNLTRMLMPEEVLAALSGGEEVPSESRLHDRLDCSAVEFRGRSELLVVGRAAALRLAKVIGREERPSEDEVVFRGTCAVPGSARGVVKVVNTPEEGEELRDGQVLVSVATDPSLEAAMSRAAAIVTDMGGITCHAAIISRELGVPCVVGTRHASRTLRDGDLVEVDATHGVVRRVES